MIIEINPTSLFLIQKISFFGGDAIISPTKRYQFLDSCHSLTRIFKLKRSMRLTHILFLLCFCILINCNASDDQNLSSRLSFRKTSSGWNRVNLGPKVLKKRRKVLKRRPSTGTKSSFIRPYNRDSRCKFLSSKC